MYQKRHAVLGVCMLLGLAVGCSNPPSPLAPNAAVPGSGAAGPDGSTLKIAAPTTVSPTGGAEAPIGFALVVGNVSGTYASFPVRYRWQIRDAAGQTTAEDTRAASAGATTSIPVTAALDYDAQYSWRVRAEYDGLHGPWSAYASFRTPAGSYMDSTTVLDLLTDGRTLGDATNVRFSDKGAFFPANSSYIAYALPKTIPAGEFSLIATGVDEGNPCLKCKVMSMGEGHVDVTDNDYRFSLELRGNMSHEAGTVAFRVITGDARLSAHREYNTNRHDHKYVWERAQTYYFKLFWRTGQAGYQIREGGPNGPIKDSATIGTGSHPYAPNPHYAFIGAPPARGGLENSTHPGMTVKNVWISPDPRPNLPTIFERPE